MTNFRCILFFIKNCLLLEPLDDASEGLAILEDIRLLDLLDHVVVNSCSDIDVFTELFKHLTLDLEHHPLDLEEQTFAFIQGLLILKVKSIADPLDQLAVE